ncbi:MAG: hypothetical protein ACKVLI_01590 [Alphaproteobacteria bacterium]
MSNNIINLFDDKVYALQNTIKLDGRLSAYPNSSKGYSPSNCYLLKEDDGAFLFDTGFVCHQESILNQLSSLISTELPLHIIPLRINEFMSVGNTKAISQKFNVVNYYSPHPEAADWFDFTGSEQDLSLKNIPTIILRGDNKYEVGNSNKRYIHTMNAPIRLINTAWIYDPCSKILFSSDMFSHGIWNADRGSWILSDNHEDTNESFVRSYLLNTRYWWLEGAKTSMLRDGVKKVFETFDIKTIAPGYGIIYHGYDMVKNQFQVLDNVLRDLDNSKIKPVYVPRGLER